MEITLIYKKVLVARLRCKTGAVDITHNALEKFIPYVAFLKASKSSNFRLEITERILDPSK